MSPVKARRARRARRGAALLVVMVVMVVIAILSTSATYSAFQETRSARHAQLQQRALAVAEFGLYAPLNDWRPSRAALPVGGVDSLNVGVDGGDTAQVRIQRLNSVDFQVVSLGRAGIGNRLLETQRQLSLLVTVARPSIRLGSVLTSFGNVDVQGSPLISGRNNPPPGWTSCAASPDTVAITHNPTSRVSVQRPTQQTVGGVRGDTAAGNPDNYDRIGSTTVSALVARANVRVGNSVSPFPVGTSSTCTVGGSNWGEPARGGGSVVGCYDYFPVIYASGDLDLQTGRGQGILIVEGSLRVRGNFTFSGLVLVGNELDGAGTFTVNGAVRTRNRNGAENRFRGNGTLSYSACAVDRALASLATPMRVGSRAWATVF